jgi:hypothetical protein
LEVGVENGVFEKLRFVLCWNFFSGYGDFKVLFSSDKTTTSHPAPVAPDLTTPVAQLVHEVGQLHEEVGE